jgi:hypothetical protein
MSRRRNLSDTEMEGARLHVLGPEWRPVFGLAGRSAPPHGGRRGLACPPTSWARRGYDMGMGVMSF